MIRPILCLAATAAVASAQVVDPRHATPTGSPGAPAPFPSPSSENGNAPTGDGSAKPPAGESSFLGKEIPFFDPGSEVITWDGKSWNINNNRIFEARFEKYLNAPPALSKEDKAYQDILQQIMNDLAPGRATPKSQDDAFRALAKASQYKDDANLCDAIASQVYTAWLARKNADRLSNANSSLSDERKRLQWNAQIIAQHRPLDGGSSSGGSRGGSGQNGQGGQGGGGNSNQRQQNLAQDLELQPVLTRIAEIEALIKANQLRREVQELQVKIEFQALIIQHFLQRRFQHAVIGTRFYRNIFADGDSQLRVGEDAKSLFAKTTGMPPTLGTIDSVANEFMRDVHEGIQAFKFLLEKGEMESATKRLAETFILGEYMPDVRTLDRADKRAALAFVQRSNQLISALQVKDFTLAEKLVAELNQSAKDIDTSKATAAIETSRRVAAMHIAKARNAALSGDKAVLEAELKHAAEIWPLNPALEEVGNLIYSQADVQSRALVDLEQLLSQKNLRGIYDDRMRFIAATSMYPDKQEKLRAALEQVAAVDKAIIQAQEIEKHQDYAGAWESVEKAFRGYSDDNKLNQIRAELTIKAADFVRALSQAEDLEQKNQPGSSLSWYLKARQEYPGSQFAKEGISRLTKQILPDAT